MEELEDSGRMGQRRLYPLSLPLNNYKSKLTGGGGDGDCHHDDILTTESDSCILGSNRTCSGHTCYNSNSTSRSCTTRTVASEESALHGSDRTYSGHTCLTGSDRASSEHTAKTLQTNNMSPPKIRRGRNPNYPSRHSGSSSNKYWTPENSTEFKTHVCDPSPTCVMQVPQPAVSSRTATTRKTTNGESTSPRKRWPTRSDAAHPNPPFLVFLEDGWRGFMGGARNIDSGTDRDSTNPSEGQSFSEGDEDETTYATGAEFSRNASAATGTRTFASDAAARAVSDDDDEDYLEPYPSSMDRVYAATQAMDRMLGPDTDSDTEGNKKNKPTNRETQKGTSGKNIPPTLEILVPNSSSSWDNNNKNNNNEAPAAADAKTAGAPPHTIEDGTNKDESILSEFSETIRSGTDSQRGRDEENVDALLFHDTATRDPEISLADGIKESLSMMAASTYTRIFGGRVGDDEINSNDGIIGTSKSSSHDRSKSSRGSSNNNSRIHIRTEIPHGNESSHSGADGSEAAGNSGSIASEKDLVESRGRVSRKCVGIYGLLLLGILLVLIGSIYALRR